MYVSSYHSNLIYFYIFSLSQYYVCSVFRAREAVEFRRYFFMFLVGSEEITYHQFCNFVIDIIEAFYSIFHTYIFVTVSSENNAFE